MSNNETLLEYLERKDKILLQKRYTNSVIFKNYCKGLMYLLVAVFLFYLAIYVFSYTIRVLP